MIIAINRTHGNRLYTVGTMTVPGTEFRCKTLELRAPEHSTAVNKGKRHAVPCGDYKCYTICTNLMIMTPRTGRIRGHGRAILVDIERYKDLSQGQISICSSVDDNGRATIIPQIAEALSALIHEGRNNDGRDFEIFLSITEDINFSYDPDVSELADTWDGSMDFTEDE